MASHEREMKRLLLSLGAMQLFPNQLCSTMPALKCRFSVHFNNFQEGNTDAAISEQRKRDHLFVDGTNVSTFISAE